MSDFSSTAARLANGLGLSYSGPPSKALLHHANDKVDDIASSLGDVESLDHLLEVVAGLLKVDLRFIYEDQDIVRVAEDFGGSRITSGFLREELEDAGTEGMLTRHPRAASHKYKYLAVIDARRDRFYRAYFTAWHEIAHVIITPRLLDDKKVRRTPPKEKRTDPVEVLVDKSAARIAFYKPIFRKSLREAYRQEQEVSFSTVEDAVERSMDGNFDVPPPSLFSATRACMRMIDMPACLVQVEEMLKKKEKEMVESPQGDLFGVDFAPKLRVSNTYKNDLGSIFEIQRKMRIPTDSVLFKVHYPDFPVAQKVQLEDQGQWETSTEGPLAPLPMTVSAVRRGAYTYGLMVAESNT